MQRTPRLSMFWSAVPYTAVTWELLHERDAPKLVAVAVAEPAVEDERLPMKVNPGRPGSNEEDNNFASSSSSFLSVA